MNHRKKTALIVISALLVIGIFAGGLYLKSISDYKAKVDALTFDEIDLTKVEDGIYEGATPALSGHGFRSLSGITGWKALNF